jgi:hypothetical protein
MYSSPATTIRPAAMGSSLPTPGTASRALSGVSEVDDIRKEMGTVRRATLARYQAAERTFDEG